MKRLKKALSIMLVISMLMSMCQFAFAEPGAVDPLPDVTIKHQGEPTTVTGDDGTSITGSKTIEKITTNGEKDAFVITLNVTTVSTSTEVTTKKPADIVMVLDVTASMDSKINKNDSKTKWEDLQDAADDFIDTVLANPADGNKIAIVSYACKGYSVLCDWTNDKASAKASYDGASSALRNPINGTGTGTNCQAGFLGADVKLNSVRDNTLRYVVYMTDGAANRCYDDSRTIVDRKLTCSKKHNHTDACYTTIYSYNAVAEDHAAIGTAITPGTDNADAAALAQAALLKQHHPDAKMFAIGIGTATTNAVINKSKNIYLDDSYTTGTMNISQILQAISNTITSEVSAAGSTVTDPMSGHLKEITLTNVTSQTDPTPQDGEVAIDADTQTLNWNLGNAKPTSDVTVKNGDVTTRTIVYELKYLVYADRDADFYREIGANGEIFTNGKTYMPYTIGDKSGTLEFDVPSITSEIPEYGFTIEYYKQNGKDANGDPTYPETPNDTFYSKNKNIIVDLHSTVNLIDYDNQYQTKYENYVLDRADTSLKISADESKNVMKVYYKNDVTSVTVNHFYKFSKVLVNGVVQDGEWPDEPQMYGEYPCNVGEAYTADPVKEFADNVYELVKSDPKAGNITCVKDASQNVINLYYELDNLDDASVIVNHVYTDHPWKWNEANGKWEQVDETAVTEKVTDLTTKAGAIFIADNKQIDCYKDYTVIAKGNAAAALTYKDGLKAGKNDPITLYFDRYGEEPATGTARVVHNYSWNEITVIDGKVNTTTHEYTYTETFSGHVGDAHADEYVVAQIKECVEDGKTYNSAEENEEKCGRKEIVDGDVTNLYYTLPPQTPATTKVTVKHHYIDIVTESVYDEETGEWIKDIDRPYENTTLGAITYSDSLYVGQSYVVSTRPVEGYTHNASKATCPTEKDWAYSEGETNMVIATAKDATVVDLYYYATPSEGRDSAFIKVVHKYVTHYTTVAGKYDGSTTEEGDTVEGFVGSGYEFSKKPTDKDGNEYDFKKIEENKSLTGQMKTAGDNGTIVIVYERDKNLRVEIGYQVNYVFETWNMAIDENNKPDYVKEDNDQYGDPYIVEIDEDNGEGDYYVGSQAPLPAGNTGIWAEFNIVKDGNPSSPQTLKAMNEDGSNPNVFTLYYQKFNPLGPGEVKVTHYYDVTKVAEDNTRTQLPTVIVEEPVQNGYLTQATSAQSDIKDFGDVDKITVNGEEVDKAEFKVDNGETFKYVVPAKYTDPATEICFYYSKEDGTAISVPVTVKHIEVTKDWKGNPVGEPVEAGYTEASSYKGLTYSASASVSEGFTLVDVTFNGDQVFESGKTLYTEVLGLPTNDFVFTYEKTLPRPTTFVEVNHVYYHDETAMAEGVNEGSTQEFDRTVLAEASYTATPVYENGDMAYVIANSTPDGYTISSLDYIGENNIITINYVRADSKYTIIHEYYTDGKLDGNVENEINAKVGEEVKTEDIEKVTSYGDNGKEYTYTSASVESIIVDADGNQTIVLRYDFTTPHTPHRPHKPVEKPEEPEEEPEPIVEPEVPEEPIVEEPEIIEELPEVEVPLAGLPEEPEELEIFEEEVPLADVPTTGDHSVIWFVLSIMAALGLAVLTIEEKKARQF